MVSVVYCKAATIAAIGAKAITPRGIETMAIAFYLLLLAGLAIGIHGVFDAIRNFKGMDNE